MSQLSISNADSKEYAVMLPCSQEEFREFISGLLSKGQTIEAVVSGTFDITRSHLINLFHLVHQRIQQQNDGALIQFNVTIRYDDSSSVQLNSLEEFERYAEIKPHISNGATLTWVYLIQFRGRPVPEKQEINVTFRTKRSTRFFDFDGRVIRGWVNSGGFEIQVKHTARSWGVDIESLLIGHLNTLKLEEAAIRKLLSRFSSYLGWIAGLAFLLASAAAISETISRFADARTGEFLENLRGSAAETEMGRLEILGVAVLTGSDARFTVGLVFFILAAVALSAIFGTMVTSRCENRRESFLALTKEAEQKMKEARLNENWFWVYLVGTLIGGVASGVIANWLFLYIFTG